MTTRPPEERWAHLDHRALLDMRHKLLDRIQARSLDVTDGTHQWTREDRNINATRSGTATTGEARRAKGRVVLDDRQLREVETLLWEKHGDSEEQLTDWYAQHCEEQERSAMEAEEAGNAAFDPAMFDGEQEADTESVPVRVAMPVPTVKVRKPKETAEQGPACGCKGYALAYMHRTCPTCQVDSCLYWTPESGTTAQCVNGHPLFPGIYRGRAVTV